MDKLGEAAQILAALRADRAGLGFELGNGQMVTITAGQIVFATLRSKRVTLILADGRELVLRSSETLTGLANRLTPYAAFVQTHNAYLVNLDRVQAITRTGVNAYELILAGFAKIPLLQNAQAVMDYFQLKSLERVTPWNERMAIILSEHLRDFDRDIRLMPTEDIRRLFSNGIGQVVITQVIGNIIWQAYNLIRAGKIDLFDGNLRSFWYSHIKPVLGRVLPEVNEGHYGAMSGVFADYVGDHHLFRYAEFGFVEDNESSRIIGDRCPHVIVLAEKKGHLRTLQKIQAQTGATVISLGGQPSLMTTEYFVAKLAKAVPLDRTFHLITDVDYDPSGQIIAESFRAQLGQMKLATTTMQHLITPANFTAEEVKYFQYPVKNEAASDISKVKQWLSPDRRKYPEREPGGIPDETGKRQPMGLESDAMPKERLIALAVAKVQAVTTGPGTKSRASQAVRGFPYPAK